MLFHRMCAALRSFRFFSYLLGFAKRSHSVLEKSRSLVPLSERDAMCPQQRVRLGTTLFTFIRDAEKQESFDQNKLSMKSFDVNRSF